MRLPKKITPCPILEAMVELRFSPLIPPDAVFGVLFSALKEKYSNAESLSILQIPEQLRVQDPNLIYKPTHKLTDTNFVLQVGPRVIAFSNIKEYAGWELFNKRIIDLFDIIFKLNIIKTFERIIIRYIDVFDGNIFNNLNLQVMLNDSPLDSLSKHLKAEIKDDNYIHQLNIADRAQVTLENNKTINSVIDINTQLELKDIDFKKDFINILKEIHLKEKAVFFKLLKADYIATLNPEY